MIITPAISTEGQVFVAQLTRDLAARELAGASALSPGARKWTDAVRSFGTTVSKAGSPTRAAKMFRAALERLLATQKTGACFVNSFKGRSRSAHFELLTYEVAKHPLIKGGYDGIVIQSYICRLQRNGRIMVGSLGKLAFVSWHALARMRERSSVDLFVANGIVAMCGMTGYLMRESDKHANTEINLAVNLEDDLTIVCTGVLRHAEENDKHYTFFDVLTVLPFDEVTDAKRKQSVAIGWAAHEYITSDNADPTGYGDKIAVLPFHENDFVSRELKRRPQPQPSKE